MKYLKDNGFEIACGIIVIVGMITIICILASCQPPKEKGCTITYKAGEGKFTADCKDSTSYSEYERDTIIYN